MAILGCLTDVLLGGHESTPVTLRLASVYDVCETISVLETLKVKDIFLKPALYRVDREVLMRLFIQNKTPLSHILRNSTYIVDFVLPQKAYRDVAELRMSRPFHRMTTRRMPRR